MARRWSSRAWEILVCCSGCVVGLARVRCVFDAAGQRSTRLWYRLLASHRKVALRQDAGAANDLSADDGPATALIAGTVVSGCLYCDLTRTVIQFPSLLLPPDQRRSLYYLFIVFSAQLSTTHILYYLPLLPISDTFDAQNTSPLSLRFTVHLLPLDIPRTRSLQGNACLAPGSHCITHSLGDVILPFYSTASRVPLHRPPRRLHRLGHC